jgi:hypothetical protein
MNESARTLAYLDNFKLNNLTLTKFKKKVINEMITFLILAPNFSLR